MNPIWLPPEQKRNRAEKRQEKRTLARTLKHAPRALSGLDLLAAQALAKLRPGATWREVGEALSPIYPPFDEVAYGISCCGCGVIRHKGQEAPL